jgi:hypothetical protein
MKVADGTEFKRNAKKIKTLLACRQPVEVGPKVISGLSQVPRVRVELVVHHKLP